MPAGLCGWEGNLYIVERRRARVEPGGSCLRSILLQTVLRRPFLFPFAPIICLSFLVTNWTLFEKGLSCKAAGNRSPQCQGSE